MRSQFVAEARQSLTLFGIASKRLEGPKARV
jgi:hypothetical protein